MPSVPGRGKLAYKLLFWFLVVSLVPMGFVGWHLINVSQKVLRDHSLHIQESLAVGFADTCYNFIHMFKDVLNVTSRLERFSAMDTVRQQQQLNRLMQNHAAFLELSVFDVSGRETVRVGRFLGPAPYRNFYDQTPFQVALQRGEYVGSLQRFQGLYPTLTIAVSIVDTGVNQQLTTRGVLLGKVSLIGLSQLLNQQFPEKSKSQAAVVAANDGFLVAHSSPTQVFSRNVGLPKEILDVILTQVDDKGGGEVRLKDGTGVLGAYATVKDVGWVVYVQQPLETAYLAANEMRRQIFLVLISVIGLIVLVSYFVSHLITQPIQSLRLASDRLKVGQFEDLPEMVLTNDEIGDLAQSFLQMSESLKEKTGELLHAKEELEKFARFLEKRVEARTRELKAAQDELIKKERLAAIGQMASVVGHEIRNPLAVINNSIYFIKAKLGQVGPVDPKIGKHISIIESEIKQANSIISEILTYSRSRELKCEIVAINGFLEELLSVVPFPSYIQVAKRLDARNPIVNIDADEMRQAVRNLIGNAIEVMPKGGVLGVMTEVIEEKWVRVDISDTGSGIPPEVLDKIFAPFFTTKARGTGLGLAVVRKVMDRHQGKVDVDSEVGKGTVFHLYLPLAAQAPALASAQAMQPTSKPIQPA